MSIIIFDFVCLKAYSTCLETLGYLHREQAHLEDLCLVKPNCGQNCHDLLARVGVGGAVARVERDTLAACLAWIAALHLGRDLRRLWRIEAQSLNLPMRRSGRIQSDSMLNAHLKCSPRRMLQIFQKASKRNRERERERESRGKGKVSKRDREREGESESSLGQSWRMKATMCSILQVCALFPLRLINCAVT